MPASIWNFIDQLTSNGATFFQRLKSVKLPDLQCHDESFKICRGRSEDGDGVTEIDVLSIFEFLRAKGVKHIEYLEVPDCLIHPHSDSQIEKCLSGFDIFSLNWRKRDMSYRMLSRAVPGLSELTFYTSGNEDILDYWASKLMQCKVRKPSLNPPRVRMGFQHITNRVSAEYNLPGECLFDNLIRQYCSWNNS